MQRLSFSFLVKFLLLTAMLGGGTPHLVQAQTDLANLFGPGPTYPDPYSAVILDVGSRRFAHDPGDWQVQYLDESALPQLHTMEFSVLEQSRNRSWRLGYEGGHYTGIHYEITASWSHNSLDLSTFGVGLGRNYPFMGGQLILRPVMALMYGNVIQEMTDIEVTTLNLTVNGTDYPEGETLDMHLHARVIEARPRIDALLRVFPGVAIRAHAGFDLSLNLHPGFVRFQGDGLDGEIATERENTDVENMSFRQDGESVSDVRFPNYGLSGLSYGIGLSYNFKHFKW